MALTLKNYNDLATQVKMWSNRKDFSEDEVSSFIYMAGSLANQALRVPAMEQVTLLDVYEDGHCVIPYDFLQLRSLTFEYGSNSSVPLNRVSWEQYVNYSNNRRLDDEDTAFFARQGPYWFLAPTPTGLATKVTCHYYKALPEISATEPTNWLVQMAPLAYLYGALHFAFLYVMDEERSAYWEQKFMGELTRIQEMSENSEFKGSRLAVRSSNTSGDYNGV